MINETDVSLAKASNAIVIGFNVNQIKKQKNLLKARRLKLSFLTLFIKLWNMWKNLFLVFLNLTEKKA